jgi:hypothetical protein
MKMMSIKSKTGLGLGANPVVWGALFVALLGFFPNKIKAETFNSLPCSVKLQFEEDQTGALAVYTLSMQVKNPTMRAIETVSVLMFDNVEVSLGNTDARCAHNDTLLNGGDTGECNKVLQVVNSKLMEKLGSEIWTSIVNDQMNKFDRISTCKIVGFRYAE